MAGIPDRIVLKRHRDFEGRKNLIWLRRAGVFVLGVFLLLGLLNLFGQHPQALRAEHPRATLELYAPNHLRGGLIYEARFTISASADVKSAVLQFSPGWNEGQTMNTLEPTPVGEASKNGDLLLTLGHIPAGQKYRLFVQFQVNPTNVGRRSADVELYDGERRLLGIHRTITIWP